MFPKDGQTITHCFLAMFHKFGQTVKHWTNLEALFPKFALLSQKLKKPGNIVYWAFTVS